MQKQSVSSCEEVSNLGVSRAMSYCYWCHQGNDRETTDSTHAFCPVCQRPIVLISISVAAELLNMSVRTIYYWIDHGWINTLKTASGRQRVCRSSLFDRPTTGKM